MDHIKHKNSGHINRVLCKPKKEFKLHHLLAL